MVRASPGIGPWCNRCRSYRNWSRTCAKFSNSTTHSTTAAFATWASTGLSAPFGFATAADDEWRFYLDLDDRHGNVGGVCHGGVLTTLVDIGMGAAAFRAVGHRPVATIELSVQFVAAAKPGNRVHGRSLLLRAVKSIVFMECEAWSQGRMVVRGTGIWKVLDKAVKLNIARPSPADGPPS